MPRPFRKTRGMQTPEPRPSRCPRTPGPGPRRTSLPARPENPRTRVRIQAQVFRRAAVQRLQYLRAGRVRVFIRVQFDKGFHAPRLLPGRIGRNGAQRARQKTAHAFLCLPAPKIIFSARRATARGLGIALCFGRRFFTPQRPKNERRRCRSGENCAHTGPVQPIPQQGFPPQSPQAPSR